MYHRSRPLLIAALAALLFTGCKRGDEPSTPVCRITSITEPGLSWQIRYNDQGGIASISKPGATANVLDEYHYYDGYAIIQHEYYLGGPARDSIIYNSLGLMTMRHITAPGNPSFWYHEEYTYNTAGELKRRVITSASTTLPQIDTFRWEQGNLVSNNLGEIYSYDTTKIAAPGDLCSLQQYTQTGWRTIRTRNLPVSISSPTRSEFFRYTRNADDQITGLEIVYSYGYGARRTVSYGYTCSECSGPGCSGQL